MNRSMSLPKSISLSPILLLSAFAIGNAPIAEGAATVNTIVRLDMDGTVDTDGVTYTGDSGNPTVPVTVGGDEFGDPPNFLADPGTMYMDSTSSTNLEADEVLLVNVGPGYDLSQNYILEAWVKPDGAKFAGSGNKFQNTFIISWWQIYDWCGLPDAVSDNIGVYMRADQPLWTRMAGGTFSTIYNQTELNPANAIPMDEYSHIALVWTWNAASTTGTFEYFMNGELKVSGTSTQPVHGNLPEVISIGNNSFSATVDPDQLACGADINFNAGFSGWFDSFAFSTFTGEFDGAPQFALFRVATPTWAGFPIEDGDNVNTGDWMGWINVTYAPWTYNFALGEWMYMREDRVNENGGWAFLSLQ